MKRYKLTIVLVVMIMFSAQVIYAEGKTIGFMGGLSITNSYGEDVNTGDDDDLVFDSKKGFCGGFFLCIPVNNIFSVQPELLYSMKGVHTEDVIDGNDTDIYFNFNYIEIPVLAKVMIPVEGSIHPNIFLGPSIGYNFSSKIKIEMLGVSGEGDIEKVKELELGVVIGGGLDFDVGIGQLVFDGRYVLGLTTTDDSEAQEDFKNKAITFMIGYGFYF